MGVFDIIRVLTHIRFSTIIRVSVKPRVCRLRTGCRHHIGDASREEEIWLKLGFSIKILLSFEKIRVLVKPQVCRPRTRCRHQTQDGGGGEHVGIKHRM